MRLKKDEMIKSIGKRFDYYYKKLNTNKKNGVHDSRDFEVISNIETLYNIALKMPVWPFDVSTFRKFFTTYTMPLILYLITKTDLIDKIKALFDHTAPILSWYTVIV
jgi:hypothetical protein